MQLRVTYDTWTKFGVFEKKNKNNFSRQKIHNRNKINGQGRKTTKVLEFLENCLSKHDVEK